MNPKIVYKKSFEEILKKHISTRERFEFYPEVYKRILKDFKGGTIIDLGAGINGLSYSYFDNKVDYVGVEAMNQLVNLMNSYFQKEEIKQARAIQASLFDLNKIKKIILKTVKPRIIFLFKTLDSLEMLEKDFSKKLLKEIVPLVDKVVVSFATKSLISKTNFKVKRYWFENFITQALSNQKKEMRKKIEGMKKEIGHILKCNMCSPKCGYNKAIQDIDDILKELDL